MKRFIFLITIFFGGFAFGQNQQAVKNEPVKHPPITSETNAEFPGGIQAFRTEFAKVFNINNVVGKGQVKANANFIIDSEGNLIQVKVFGENESLNTEVKRAIESIKTKWKPVTVNNYPLRTRQNLPITINL